MAMSKITLFGFYKYYNLQNKDFFENLLLPVGIDKDVVVGNILEKGGEFEVLYSDPDFCTEMMYIWSKKWNRTFTKWYEALNISYNPLENYDRMEEWHSIDVGESHNKLDMNSNSSNENHSTDLRSVFNSSAFENDAHNDSNGSANVNSNTLSDGEAKNVNDRTGRLHGNIGVTTSQQMLQAELDIAAWNLYDHITDVFLKEFIIPVY